MADDALVAAAKQGDPEAWRTLHLEHAGRLVVWLRTRPTGDVAASAEDVAGEAWYVAAQKIADFTGSSSEFGGWLFGIARRISSTSRRTSDRRATHATEEVDEGLEPSVEPQVDVEHNDWVRQTISVLPPREREAVALVDGLGFDSTSAGEILGVSAVAVRVARHRGLRRLRRLAAGPGVRPGSPPAQRSGEPELAPATSHAPGPTPAT